MFLSFIFSDQVIFTFAIKKILNRGRTTKENIKKIQKYNIDMLDERKQLVNWCKTDTSLFDLKTVLTEEQIEILKHRWALDSIRKSSNSF